LIGFSDLQAVWQQVKANKRVAGIVWQSIEVFATNELVYLSELAKNLEQKSTDKKWRGW